MQRPHAPGFLKLLWFLLQYVCVCVCVSVCPPPRALITSGVRWCDIGHVRLVKQVLWLFPYFYMTLAIDRMDGRGHINTAHREHLLKKTKVMWY